MTQDKPWYTPDQLFEVTGKYREAAVKRMVEMGAPEKEAGLLFDYFNSGGDESITLLEPILEDENIDDYREIIDQEIDNAANELDKLRKAAGAF